MNIYFLNKTTRSLFVAVQLADGFNGADLRNVGTEAGLFAIRADRDYVLEVCDGLIIPRCLAAPIHVTIHALCLKRGTSNFRKGLDMNTS